MPDRPDLAASRFHDVEPAVHGRIGGTIDQQLVARRPGEADNLVVSRCRQRQQLKASVSDAQQTDVACFVGVARVTAPHLVRERLFRQVIRKRNLAQLAPIDVVDRDVAAVRRPGVGRATPDARADFRLGATVTAKRHTGQTGFADLGQASDPAVGQHDRPQVTACKVGCQACRPGIGAVRICCRHRATAAAADGRPVQAATGRHCAGKR